MKVLSRQFNPFLKCLYLYIEHLNLSHHLLQLKILLSHLLWPCQLSKKLPLLCQQMHLLPTPLHVLIYSTSDNDSHDLWRTIHVDIPFDGLNLEILFEKLPYFLYSDGVIYFPQKNRIVTSSVFPFVSLPLQFGLVILDSIQA